MNVVGRGSVTRSPDQPDYRYGDVVTLSASADPGWSFVGWDGDLSGTSASASITVEGNQQLTAEFVANPAATLSLSLTAGAIDPGQSVRASVMGHDGQGYAWDVTADTCFSVEGQAGGVWAGNAYTGERVGQWTVTAEYQALSATVSLTVNPFQVFLPVLQGAP